MTEQILSNCSLRRLAMRGDERGSLIAIEAADIPFRIERVYYIFDTKREVERGFHAHRDLRQLAMCVSGSCVMVVDDGRERRDVLLNEPGLALEIGPMIWREMRDFSEGAVLLVLASAPYSEADYVRDYDAFLALARG